MNLIRAVAADSWCEFTFQFQCLQETSTDSIRSNVLRMAPLFRCCCSTFYVAWWVSEQRQELLSPKASNENAIELSSRLAYDP